MSADSSWRRTLLARAATRTVSKNRKQRKPKPQNPKPRRIRRGFPIPLLIGLVIAGLTLGLYGFFSAEKGHEKHAATDHAAEHGGLITTVGHRKYELVRKESHVMLYVSKDRTPLRTAGGVARLEFLKDGRSETVVLTPVGENGFEAMGPGTFVAAMPVSATVKLEDDVERQLRFTQK